MAEKKRFLVAIDGSAESKSLVRYVSGILSPVNTELIMLHILNKVPEAYWDFGSGFEVDSLSKKIIRQVKAHEEAIKGLMTELKTLLLQANFREENVSIYIKDRDVGIARDIVAEAVRGYNGLIMGCTGAGRMRGLAVGSVSTKIIGAMSSIPICVVSGSPTGKNVIVALDGSPGSMKALDYACWLMNGSKEKVILFHALRRIGYLNPSTGNLAAFDEMEKALWADIQKMLEPTIAEAKNRLARAGRAEDSIITKIATGVPSRAGALIEQAMKSDCGSIIVGRTGVSQVEDFNIGRVANKVVQGARNQAVWIIP